MIEAFVSRLQLEAPGAEEPAATRDRLRDHFPRGATRRMTQLGMIVGRTLLALEPKESDALVYLSAYGETRALEAYLDSFPTASPTLFQTSIHPSAVEQALIGRQQPVREFLPLTGDDHLVAQGLTAALLAARPRALVCGGEERGTWLLAQAAASEQTFAFAFALGETNAEAVARVTLGPGEGAAAPTPWPLATFFQALQHRRNFTLHTPAAQRLEWNWL